METRASYQDLTFKWFVSNQIDISMLRILFSSLSQTCEQVTFLGGNSSFCIEICQECPAQCTGPFPTYWNFYLKLGPQLTLPSVECVLTYKVNVTVENHFAGSRLTPTTSALLSDFNVYSR